MDITVVTSITGGKDGLVEDQFQMDGVKYVAYVDKPVKSKVWEVREAYKGFTDPRRNSRIHKILIHKYVDTEYSVWIDGNISIQKDLRPLIKEKLEEFDLAVSKHPTRECVYEEAYVCAAAGFENPDVLLEQMNQYEKEQFEKKKGMAECGFILRRQTEDTERFNNYWWSEYCRYSKRDQISFPVALDRTAMRVNYLFEPVYTNPLIKMFNHLTKRD